MEKKRQQEERHPHEKVLDKIAELLQFTYDNADKPIPDEQAIQIAAQLVELEKQVMEFKKTSEKILEGSGLTDYVYETMLESSKDDPFSLLHRAESLKVEAQAAAKDLQKAASDARAAGKTLTDKTKKKKQSPQARKSKFRSFGGTKNWKPL